MQERSGLSGHRATDARAVQGLDSAVDRAKAYLDAGADAIFPEAMQNENEFAEFAKRMKAPLLANMTEFGKGPLLSVKQLEEMGYALAIFPQHFSASARVGYLIA